MCKVMVVYDSLTGMGKYFCEKVLSNITEDVVYLEAYAFSEKDIVDDAVYILQTRSEGFGEIPDDTLDFLEDYKEVLGNKLKGTFVTGSKNWGRNFGGSAYKIEEEFGLENLIIYEGNGFKKDVYKAIGILNYILSNKELSSGGIKNSYIDYLMTTDSKLSKEDGVYLQELFKDKIESIIVDRKGDKNLGTKTKETLKNISISIGNRINKEDNYLGLYIKEILEGIK